MLTNREFIWTSGPDLLKDRINLSHPFQFTKYATPAVLKIMSTTTIQVPTAVEGFSSLQAAPKFGNEIRTAPIQKHDVETTLNFHKDNEDGSPPHPTYVDRPETYDRPVETHKVTIHDVRGEEDKYSLDQNGFEIIRRPAQEKDFLDDDKIKTLYYAEVDQLLKDV